jgi:hypothetical protein
MMKHSKCSQETENGQDAELWGEVLNS